MDKHEVPREQIGVDGVEYFVKAQWVARIETR